MHKTTPSLVSAIRDRRFGQAERMFTRIMQEKVQHALSGVRKTLMEADEDEPVTEGADKCVHCGSTKFLEVIDGSAICADCDPER